VSNVIDLVAYGHTDNWERNPLARRVSHIMHRKSWTDRWIAAKANNDYETMDSLDREWEVVQSCY
jgi:hypothetical protein